MISQYDFVTSVYLDHATIFVLVVYSCTWLLSDSAFSDHAIASNILFLSAGSPILSYQKKTLTYILSQNTSFHDACNSLE